MVRREGGRVPQTELGPPRPRPTTALAPGAERTYTLSLEAADARFLASGRYEIVLTGLGGFTLREPFARCTLVVD